MMNTTILKSSNKGGQAMFSNPTEKVVDSTTMFLNDLFSEYYMAIPAYQRPYSWEREQAEELWDDIIACMENDDQHYIGPMYFKVNIGGTKDHLEVTDGQQRLTSITLLLLALKRQLGRFEKVSDYKKYQYIISNVDNYLTKKNEPRLSLGSSDKDAFTKIYESYNEIPHHLTAFQDLFDPNEIFLKSAILLQSNFVFFDDKFKSIDNLSKERRQLSDDVDLDSIEYKDYQKEVLDIYASILNTLMFRFVVIRCSIISSDDIKAFKLFDTINDRGKQLDQVDKIKNYFFKNVFNMTKVDSNSKYVNDYKSLQNMWSDLQRSLDNDLEDYIRYYLIQSNYLKKYIVPKKLFSEIQDAFEGKYTENSDFFTEQEMSIDKEKILRLYQKTLELVKELHKHRECYNLIIEPSRSTLINNDIIKSNLKYTYQYKIIRALLLREVILYRTSDLKKLSKLIAITTNAAILYVSVFGLRKLDTVERNIWKTFFDRDRLVEDPDSLGLNLDVALNSTDKSFTWNKNSLEDKIQMLTNDTVSYYLQCKLNDYLNDGPKCGDYYYPLINQSPSKSAFNKDHILPQSFDADFKMIIDDYFNENDIDRPSQKQFRNEYVTRIGNIIPLKRNANINKSNTSDPIGFYNSLEVKGILVQELVKDYQTWGPSEILDRSRKLAKMIVDNNVLTLDMNLVKF